MRRTAGYTVLALAVLGLAGAASADDPGKGNFLFEDFYSIPDNNITDNVDTLKADPDFPDNPDRGYWVQALERPDGGEDYWGCRGRGYIYPPQTGDYTFWIASDDDSELWLSTDEGPANISLIANVEGWTNFRDFAGSVGAPGANQKSAPINLTAGKRYYVEVLQSDGTGGGHVSVAWGGPGIGAGPVVIAGTYLAPVMRDPEPMFMARNPRPADGAIGVAAPLVEWDAGTTAFWHDIYFGTDPNPPLVVERQTVGPMNVYFHMAGLEPGVVYYWKIDEVEEDGVTIHEGPVWSFVSQDVKAYYPRPPDSAWSVSPTVTLMWEAGRAASKHHLYLGEDADAVAQGAPETDMGEIVGETSYTPTDLKGATTYHWRVDAIADDGTVQTGAVWSFTTFILVDDFERYTPDDWETGDAIWEVWIDGLTNLTGSIVGYFDAPYQEQTVVHGGNQSMPFDFNNVVAPYYSEAELPLDPIQDWTVSGVDTLSLWFRGYPVPFLETADGITMSAMGADIVGLTDEFRYAWKRLSGDGSISVKVESLDNTHTWAKAGVMIRQGLIPADKAAHMIVTPTGRVEFQYRELAATGTTELVLGEGAVTLPCWVRLTRTGDTITGQYSTDGTAWQLLTAGEDTSTRTLSFIGSPYIGLAVTSHVTGTSAVAQFSNVETIGATGAWQVSDIGVDHMGNGQASLYVGIQDSSNKSAFAVHPDPAATNISDWTEWKIPLSSFGGVNLAKVGRLIIGVGDRDNPTADGAGLLFVDDIRVTMPEPEPEPESEE